MQTEAADLSKQRRERGWLLHDWEMKAETEIQWPDDIGGDELTIKHPELKTLVIQGLLRRGEVMNVNCFPENWEIDSHISMAVAVGNGVPWIGMPTVNLEGTRSWFLIFG